MRTLLKKPIIILWIVLILIALVLLGTKGLKYGVDFSGGTAFQIALEKPVSPEEINQTASVISRRLDWSGSKDAKVTPSGTQYIIAQLAESNPDEINKIKATLLKQGKFEAVLDGEVLFSGEDIKSIFKDPSKGYGLLEVDKQSKTYQWTLPFLLSPEGAQKFAKMTFHKCVPIGSGTSDSDYECSKTYFFIDRPIDSIIIMDKELYLEEQEVPIAPEMASQFIPIEDVLEQLNTNYYAVDKNSLSVEEITKLTTDYNIYKKAIVSPAISDNVKKQLEEIGYKVIVREKSLTQPWIWEATGLKSIVSITPGIANMDVPTIESTRFKTFSQLTITGNATGEANAKARLDDLLVILESGSLPIPIDSISTESISPYLGKDFLNYSLLIGIIAILLVSIVLFIRYKYLKLALPIILTASSEIIILLGLLAFINFRLDLAAVAGILATIGTCADSSIIIVDELLKGKAHHREVAEGHTQESLKAKIKHAFFIVFASASTVIATMLPIVIMGGGISKLIGFAITILLGTLIGIVIARPVYSQIARRILLTDEQHARMHDNSK
ncbi:MAG: hypothetical protein WCF78_03570 [archaeon]